MDPQQSNYDYDALCSKAIEASSRAHAPYSRFRVGAAVAGASGIYIGVNVENASHGLTLCAERVALAAAITAGDRVIQAIAVACVDANPSRGIEEFVPCGACRQWIVELAPEADVIVVGQDRRFTITELLPTPFSFSLRDNA